MWRMRGQTYVILGIIILIIVSVFAVTNVDTVKVTYLFWTGESPLILVILFSVLMGGLITAAAGYFKMHQLQRENKSLKTRQQDMETLLKKHKLLDKLPENKKQHDHNKPKPVENKKQS